MTDRKHGANNPNALFTVEQVEQIRRERIDGCPLCGSKPSYTFLARKHGCGYATIEDICKGRTYKHRELKP